MMNKIFKNPTLPFLLILLINSCSYIKNNFNGDTRNGPIDTSNKSVPSESEDKKEKIDEFAKEFDRDVIDYIFITEAAIDEFGVLLEPIIDGVIQIEESRRLTFDPYISTNSKIETIVELKNFSVNEQDYIHFQCRDIFLESDFSVLVFLNGRIAGGNYYSQEVVKESYIDPKSLNGKNVITFECSEENIELVINGTSAFLYDKAPIQEGNSILSFEIKSGSSVVFKIYELILNRYEYSKLE